MQTRSYRLALGVIALGVATPAHASFIESPAGVPAPQPWTVTVPTTPPAEASPAPTAPPGPDNPQASVEQWGRPAPSAVPTVRVTAPAAPPLAPTARRGAHKAGPGAPRVRRVAQGRSAVGSTWYVGPGDSLWSIARAHGTTVEALVAANARRHPSLLRDPGFIRDGWQLVIPR